MSQTLKELLIGIIFLMIVCYVAILFLPKHGKVVYNCSITEISPDFPIEVREQCRKLNMEKIK